jgi:hypothetical protein
MRTVTIYLRAVENKEKKQLALFDSNRTTGLDGHTTEVPAGALIVWKLDRLSGIKSITRIYPKGKERIIFKTDPKKRMFCQSLSLQLSQDIKVEVVEAYAIEYVLCNGEKMAIDPFIRIIPH